MTFKGIIDNCAVNCNALKCFCCAPALLWSIKLKLDQAKVFFAVSFSAAGEPSGASSSPIALPLQNPGEWFKIGRGRGTSDKTRRRSNVISRGKDRA